MGMKIHGHEQTFPRPGIMAQALNRSGNVEGIWKMNQVNANAGRVIC
jgi:hypothetical protein